MKAQAKVLIVDDEASLRRVLRMNLAVLGFETVEASTGEGALAMLRTDHCDVVLLDLNMPGMGGIKACRELRRRDAGLQIIALTVRDRQEDRMAAFDAGANEYLRKPYSVPDLLALVESRASAWWVATTSAQGTKWMCCK